MRYYSLGIKGQAGEMQGIKITWSGVYLGHSHSGGYLGWGFSFLIVIKVLLVTIGTVIIYVE